MFRVPGESFKSCGALLYAGTIRNTGYKQNLRKQQIPSDSVDELDWTLPAEFIMGAIRWLPAGMRREIFIQPMFL